LTAIWMYRTLNRSISTIWQPRAFKLLNSPEDVVQKLIHTQLGMNQNITTDNWLISHPSPRDLLTTKRITTVRLYRKPKTDTNTICELQGHISDKQYIMVPAQLHLWTLH
jgi:hypothetical protein